MAKDKVQLLVVIFQLLFGCATSLESVAAIDCSSSVGRCLERKQACVNMGIPSNISTCDIDCQAKVLSNLYSAGVTADFHTGAPSSTVGCVGYRADLGGTKQGAQCIANVLGYEFRDSGCNEDGWPYNVRVR